MVPEIIPIEKCNVMWELLNAVDTVLNNSICLLLYESPKSFHLFAVNCNLLDTIHLHLSGKNLSILIASLDLKKKEHRSSLPPM